MRFPSKNTWEVISSFYSVYHCRAMLLPGVTTYFNPRAFAGKSHTENLPHWPSDTKVKTERSKVRLFHGFWFVFSGPQAARGYYGRMATGTSHIIELYHFHNKLVNFVERNPLRQPSKLKTELYILVHCQIQNNKYFFRFLRNNTALLHI